MQTSVYNLLYFQQVPLIFAFLCCKVNDSFTISKFYSFILRIFA